MSDAKKDGLDGILHAMRYGPIPPHKHDRELMWLLADQLATAWKAEKFALVSKAESEKRWADHYFKYAQEGGNGAELLGAVKFCVQRITAMRDDAVGEGGGVLVDDLVYESCCNMLARIEAALAAPARPCDKYGDPVSAMAELKRRHHECAEEGHPCREDCPDCGKEKCAITWLMSPEKGGEP